VLGDPEQARDILESTGPAADAAGNKLQGGFQFVERPSFIAAGASTMTIDRKQLTELQVQTQELRTQTELAREDSRRRWD